MIVTLLSIPSIAGIGWELLGHTKLLQLGNAL